MGARVGGSDAIVELGAVVGCKVGGGPSKVTDGTAEGFAGHDWGLSVPLSVGSGVGFSMATGAAELG